MWRGYAILFASIGFILVTCFHFTGAQEAIASCALRIPRNVVVTGSSRGLGKALVREFLTAGDSVVLTSRNESSVREAIEDLQREFVYSGFQRPPLGIIYREGNDKSLQRSLLLPPGVSLPLAEDIPKVVGVPCDVRAWEEVQQLAQVANNELGEIDIWVNNAGINSGAKSFLHCSSEEIDTVVSTNLLGTVNCIRAAISLMLPTSCPSNPPSSPHVSTKRGHIFIMEGAGSGGSPTPTYAVYGSTKSALRQLYGSLLEELRGLPLGLHTASPGMVLTDLLLSGATLENKKAFNLVSEQPETVARSLVPKMRAVRSTGQEVRYLTLQRIVLALATAWLRRERWFDSEGNVVYESEAERIRKWAEEKEKIGISEAIKMVPSGAWISLASSSLICAYAIITTYWNDKLGI